MICSGDVGVVIAWLGVAQGTKSEKLLFSRSHIEAELDVLQAAYAKKPEFDIRLSAIITIKKACSNFFISKV